MILLDANLFMYAAGAEHPNKAPAGRFLEGVTSGEVEAAIDAETLQEILHRYRAIRRWDDGRRVYDLARKLVPVVLPVTGAILDRARDLLDGHPDLMARDALHAAIALAHTSGRICSFDTDFDGIEGVQRTEPGEPGPVSSPSGEVDVDPPPSVE